MTTNHSTMTGANLHFAKLSTNVGAPLSAPSFVGQTWVDTNTNILYCATGTSTVSDWKILGYIQTTSISSNTALTAIQELLVYVDVSGAPVTVTLPAHVDGLSITICDYTYSSYTNNITVARNGGTGTIGGQSASFVMASDGSAYTFVSNYATSDWRIL